jgi:preprotein translocase subunit SecE
MRYKVSWPKYSALQSSSILVLVASFIFALVIGVMDLIFDNGMQVFYQSF